MIFTNPSQSRESTLLVEWGKHSLSFSVFHEQDNRVLHAEVLDLEKELNDYAIQDFEKLFKALDIFAFSFERLICLIDTTLSTLVPAPEFDATNNEALLNFVHDIPSGNFLYLDEEVLSSDYNLVYAFPSALKEAMEKHFVNPEFSISQMALLNYFAKLSQLNELFTIHLNDSELSIYYYKENKLLFFNAFSYISAEDIVYHVLNVLNSLGLDNERCLVYYSGLLPEDAENINLLKQYVKFLKPLERTNRINYASAVEAMPTHYFIQHYASFL